MENTIKRKIGRAALRSFVFSLLMLLSAVLYSQQWSQFPFDIRSNEVHKLGIWNNRLVIAGCIYYPDTLLPMFFFTWDGLTATPGSNLTAYNGGIRSFETYQGNLLIGGTFDGFSDYYNPIPLLLIYIEMVEKMFITL